MDTMWYVYFLRCSDDSLYCGITTDIERREGQHNKGTASKYTRSRLPAEMVWNREVGSKSEALKEEYRLKQLSKSEKESLISS